MLFKKYTTQIALFTSILCCCSMASAWWQTGHMIVAAIAYQHLDSKAKATIDRWLPLMKVDDTPINQYNQPTPLESFMAISHWADDIKPALSSEWHYTNLAFSTDGTALPKYTNPENVVWAIKNLPATILNKKENRYERMRALAYLVHFVGDIHQPLHDASRYSQQSPQGDQGGNLYKIHYTEVDNTKITNLHELWDSALLVYPEHGFPYDDQNLADVKKLASDVMQDYPATYFGAKTTDLNPQHWAQQGFKIAKTLCYKVPMTAVPSSQYMQQDSKVAEQQLALAGYRLANLLNKLLG